MEDSGEAMFIIFPLVRSVLSLHSIVPSGGYHWLVFPLLGGLVLGDLGLLAGAGSSVSTAGSVHALEGLALLACGRGGGLEF